MLCFFEIKNNKNDKIILSERVIILDATAKKARLEYQRKYQEENRERLNEYQREYRAKHPEKVKQYNQSYWERKALQPT